MDDLKIKYAFYSIKNNCFFKERNNKKIDNLNDFINNEAQIFPYNNDNDNSIITPTPIHINLFENMLYDEFIINNKIFFENIRNKCFKDNYGPKMGDVLLKNISETLKEFVSYTNEFKILFLFSFPSHDFFEFQNCDEKNDLIYLLKINNNIYILFKNYYFEINSENNLLVKCDKPEINQLDIKKRNHYNKNEFDLPSMEDIYNNPLIYLYKIYYLGENLLRKKENYIIKEI